MEKKKKQKRQPEFPITAITVKGFKSIRDETNIEIKPLTILAGANCSGKSSIMQPLLLLKQTQECEYDPGPLFLDGPNAKFSLAEQLLWKDKEKIFDSFTIGLKSEENDIRFIYKKAGEKGKGFLLENQRWTDDNGIYNWSPNMTPEDILKNIPEGLIEAVKELSKQLEKDMKLSIKRDKSFLSLSPFSSSKFPFSMLFSPYGNYIPVIRKMIHLPGLRGNPARSYQNIQATDNYKGHFQNYTAGIISNWIENDKPKILKLSSWMKKLNLTWKVHTVYEDDANIQLKVGRLPRGKKEDKNDLVNIADVGFGVSQVLPVLVALLVAEPNQIVYIEQPEIHLHPRAKVVLAKLISETAKRGVFLIIETHCDIILRAIQTQIAKGNLKKDSVKLHWFRRGRDGSTKVTSADIDERGSYGKWPVDFADIDLRVEEEFIEAASRKRD